MSLIYRSNHTQAIAITDLAQAVYLESPEHSAWAHKALPVVVSGCRFRDFHAVRVPVVASLAMAHRVGFALARQVGLGLRQAGQASVDRTLRPSNHQFDQAACVRAQVVWRGIHPGLLPRFPQLAVPVRDQACGTIWRDYQALKLSRQFPL